MVLSRIPSNDHDCLLMAWHVKTGRTQHDYDNMKATYLEKTGKSKYVFNYMWYDHTKINHYIEDVGTLLQGKHYETSADLDQYWRHIDIRIENFESLYGLRFHRDLAKMMS